jgi:6-phosphogluconolactonase
VVRQWLSLLLAALLSATSIPGAGFLVYAGTYTRPNGSKGIYAYRFDTSSGKLNSLGLAAETVNPAFLVEHPNHKFLYAANETGSGTVSAFSIDAKTGKLTLLNQVPSGGSLPNHIAIDRTGRWVAVTNYGDGSYAIMPVAADGKLGAAVVGRHEGSSVTERQRGPHAHNFVFSPDNRNLLLADLGLDKIFVYRFDPAKGITPADPPFATVLPGAGVRHLVFHPNGRIVYAIAELNSTITAFSFDPSRGTLTDFQVARTLPGDYRGNSTTAEIVINKAGTMVYGSNRGHDSIAMFRVDPDRFTLSPPSFAPTLGKSPRHIAFDPTGGYIFAANQESNSIAMFRVHAATGQLTPHGESARDAPAPACIVFVPR